MTEVRWVQYGVTNSLSLYEPEVLRTVWDGIPVARGLGRTMIASGGGLTWLSDAGALEPFKLPGTISESDEIHLTADHVVGTSLYADRLELRLMGWHSVEIRTFRADIAVGDSRDISDSYCVCNSGFISVITPLDRLTTMKIYALDGSAGGGDYLRYVAGFSLELPKGFEIVSCTPWHVVVQMDQGVNGDRMIVFNANTGSPICAVASDYGTSFWCMGAERVVLAVRNLGSDELLVLRSDGVINRAPTTGRIGGLGGDDEVCLVATFDGISESVFEVLESASVARLVLTSNAGGRKHIGRGVAAWIDDGAISMSVEGPGSFSAFVGPADARSGTYIHERAVRSNGATALRLFDGRTPAGVVVHLHGGPESYETDEPRLFGLPAYAVDTGWEWRSLNYRGSRGVRPTDTTSAWLDWESTLLDDLGWVLSGTAGLPVVLAGWSFGASLALAAAKHFNIAGLIIGGAMASLRDHVDRATGADPAHRAWFDRRFALESGDGRFLDGTPPAVQRQLRVVSFHGRNDQHCPADLFEKVREQWVPRVTSWTHYDLPGEEHYATVADDALLVQTESRRLLSRLLVTV